MSRPARGIGLLCLAAAWAVLIPGARAQPSVQYSALDLYFTVTNDATPGYYDYTFRLVADGVHVPFQSGEGFGGIVFADVYQANSPLIDFTLNPGGDLGPFTSLTQTGDDGTGTSYHNGPTLAPVFNSSFTPVYWFPAGLGDELMWTGVSSTYVTSLDFSTIFDSVSTTRGANFQPAIFVPEPGTLLQGLTALAVGTAAAGRMYSRRRRAGR